MQNLLNEALGKVKTKLSEFTCSVMNSKHDFIDNIMERVHNPTPKSHLFPYTYFENEDRLFYCDDGSFGFGMIGNPIVGCDPNTYKQISLLISDQLPFGGSLQTLLLASDNLDEAIFNWSKGRVAHGEIYRKLEDYKARYYKSYNQNPNENFKHRNYKLFFFFSLTKKHSKAEAIAFREHFKLILETLRIQAQEMDAPSFLALLKEIVNYPDFSESSYKEHDLIGEQITDLANNLLVEEDGLLHQIGEYVSRLYQVDGFPEHFSLSEMPSLLGDSRQDNMQIPARFLISYTIINNISSSAQEGLKNKGDMIVKQARGMLSLFNSSLKDEGEEWVKIEGELKKREKFMTSSFLVMLSAKHDRISKAEQSLLSLWRKNDIHLKPTKYFHLPALLSICPFLASSGLLPIMKSFNLTRTVLSNEAKALLPVSGEWKGSFYGGMLLTGKKGQLFSWDSFEGGSNYNACIIGESGSGKSVFLQEFVMSHLARGAKVFVIDIGRSFEKTVKILGGDFVDFNATSQISLNPFQDIPDNDSADADSLAQDSLNLLKFTISKMVAPKSGTEDVQDAIISTALFETWNKYRREATIDHLAEVLSTRGDRGKDLSLMLFEYTSKGSYGKFFSGKNNISFSKDLTVLEFESLRERPDLGSVIMQMLSIKIIQQVYLSDRKRKFIMLFDEAWYSLLNFPKLLASMARTLRKYNGALVLGTQSMTDFYSSDSGITDDDKARASVIENSAWRVLLKQKADSAERAVKIGLDPGQINLVKNLNTVKGHYSESLIFQSENDYFVARLMLDKFSSVLYSSSPEVFSRVNQLIESGSSTPQAIEKVMEQIYGTI